MRTQQLMLYAAQEVVRDDPCPAPATLVQSIIDAPWFGERWPRVAQVVVHVVDRDLSCSSSDDGGMSGHIELRPDAGRRTVCHELAHVAADSDGVAHRHDPAFAESYLLIVFHVLGLEAWRAMRHSFIESDVCFDPRCGDACACARKDA